MGIKQIAIVLHPGPQGGAVTFTPGEELEFAPGQTVNGALVLDIGGRKPHKLRAALVKVRGEARNQWTTGTGNSTTNHISVEQLLRLDLPQLEASGGQPIALPPGQHQFPFTFALPLQLAHTQKYAPGKVSYECKARATSHSFWSSNGRGCTKFRVLPYRDLSREPELAQLLTVQREARPLLLRRDPGPFQVRLTRRGFTAGEVIDVWLDGPDRAFEVLAAADDAVQLKARIVLHAGSKTREEKKVLANVRPGHSPAAWRHIQLTVPEREVTMADIRCTIIEVTHYVKVRDAHLAVILGTVPLPPS